MTHPHNLRFNLKQGEAFGECQREADLSAPHLKCIFYKEKFLAL